MITWLYFQSQLIVYVYKLSDVMFSKSAWIADFADWLHFQSQLIVLIVDLTSWLHFQIQLIVYAFKVS